ncbi:MAG: ABC transporter permease subunit [Chlorobium sp.]|nr:MAG: ABC transporter permease subunit [Chlorobium sp.]
MRQNRLLVVALLMLVTLFVGCGKSDTVITTLDDARDAKIGVMTGTTGEALAVARFPQAKIQRFDDVMDAVAALKAGQLDAIVTLSTTAIQVSKKNQELWSLPESLKDEETCAVARKGDDALLAKINAIIGELKADGALKEMKMRWLKSDLSPYEERTIELSSVGDPLKVGVCATREPISFVDKHGRVTGFDGELARLLGAGLNRPVEFYNMKFMALIPALKSGKIDVIVSGMSATPERRKSVNFSQPYFVNPQVMLVKKARHAAAGSGGDGNGGVSLFLKGLASSFQSNLIQENRYLLILDGLKTTLLISVLSTIFGTLLGGVVCFMRMSQSLLLNMPAKLYISLLRGTPVLVFLMLIFYVVFASVNIDPVLVAVVAFGMNFAAYVAEIFRSGVESIDKGQSEAGIAMGFSKVKTFLYIVLPQTVQRILPVYKGEFISLVKMTSIVGYIAVQDLTKASDIIRSRTFDAFFPLVMVAMLYFLLSWLLMQFISALERMTDPKYKKRRFALRSSPEKACL